MKKRYKVVLNVEVTDPEKPFPAGGDYTHLNTIEGALRRITSELVWVWPGGAGGDVKVTLDKVIDKGVIDAPSEPSHE